MPASITTAIVQLLAAAQAPCLHRLPLHQSPHAARTAPVTATTAGKATTANANTGRKLTLAVTVNHVTLSTVAERGEGKIGQIRVET